MRQRLFPIAMLAALLLVTSCGEEKRKGHDEAKYQTMVVSRKDMTLERRYSARLTGRQIVEVRPQVSGCITPILTGEGDRHCSSLTKYLSVLPWKWLWLPVRVQRQDSPRHG